MAGDHDIYATMNELTIISPQRHFLPLDFKYRLCRYSALRLQPKSGFLPKPECGGPNLHMIYCGWGEWYRKIGTRATSKAQPDS
jgi:hypothetical protein